MGKCIICNRLGYQLCLKCRSNPYKTEKGRQILSKKRKLDYLKKTYNLKFAEIENLNTSRFWDNKLEKAQYLKDQDGMTKDRVKTAFRYVPKNSIKVLDIGIGSGFIEELLSKRKEIDIYANDISPKTITNVKNRFKGIFKVESLYNMTYPDDFFDSILMLEVIEHIPPSKTFHVLTKIKKILKNEGSLIISVPMNEGLETMNSNPSGHVRMYTQDLIKSELELCSFKVIKEKTIYAFSNFYILKTFISKIIKKWKPNNIVILAKST